MLNNFKFYSSNSIENNFNIVYNNIYTKIIQGGPSN